MLCPVPLALCLFLAAVSSASAEQVTISAPKHDLRQAPVRVPLTLPQGVTLASGVTLKDETGQVLPGQLTGPSLLAPEGTTAELHFIVPELKAGQTRTYTATFAAPASGERFVWQDTAGQYAELSFDKRPVLRYMYEKLDDSSPARREETYKVFHHVYDPSGKFLVTKGPGGQYTHHRGLFYAFNKVTYGDGKSCDVWHCKPPAHQAHQKFLNQEGGPVLGRHRVKIGWHGLEKEPFAVEERELTAYHTPDGTLLEFASRLTTAGGPIRLDGDPQHAGFHFRASNEVSAKTAKQTYFLRPDGPGKPGETRNWPALKTHVDLPWNAMSFVLGEQRFTAVYLDRPQNPKEARFSERDYGRFGSYFEYTLAPGKSLDLNYRIWLQVGEVTQPQAEALSAAFVSPPVGTAGK